MYVRRRGGERGTGDKVGRRSRDIYLYVGVDKGEEKNIHEKRK